MDTKRSDSGPSSMIVARVADEQWHVLEDDLVVGRGHSMRRPDGRLFISIDAWRSAAFDRLAEAMLADLPAPLYTVVDEAHTELAADWHRAGFTVRRREWEFVLPTDPLITGLAAARPPSGVRIIPVGEADRDLLRVLDRAIRAEVEAGAGWQSMPAEAHPRPQGVTLVDPARYAVAAASDRYLGLLRLVTATRRPRIGLIAVLASEHRRGIARALLSHVLGTMHLSGTASASAEADESNKAAVALLEGIGGRRMSRSLELAR
ncbi:MAG TPA: GNAT family N-acetyltransferase [Streptosporangiaceae bacterium]|nr:GNAT family N-acetyltransferase [Streptosporangiaceae bacterium]